MQTSLSLPQDLSDQVEDLRFTQRFPSRNAVLLELVRAGIEVVGNRPPPTAESMEAR